MSQSFAFSIQAWRGDPKLALCCAATRGFWFELICCMYDARAGSITGTMEDFARLGRCTFREANKAIEELTATQTADVCTNLDGSKTIACRRLMHQQRVSKLRQISGSKGASKTNSQREATPFGENGDQESALLRVREFCKSEGIRGTDADWFFYKCEGNGWTNGGQPIKDWKATIRTWWRRGGIFPSQKPQGRFGFAKKEPGGPTVPRNEVRKPREPTEAEWQRSREIAQNSMAKFREQMGGGATPK